MRCLKKMLIPVLLLSAALLLSGCVFTIDPKDSTLSQTPPSSPNGTGNNNSGGVQDSNARTIEITLTLQEIAKHSSANDCWMAIGGRVLDLSNFTSHPSGSTYAPYCGTDATNAYNTKGGRGAPHSSTASSMFADFFIGNLGDKIKVFVSGTSVASGIAKDANSRPASTPGGRDDDFEEGDD